MPPQNNRALAILNLSDNNCDPKKSRAFIAPIAALLFQANTRISELNVASNELGAEASRLLAEGIKDNKVLASLTFCSNGGSVTINTKNGRCRFQQQEARFRRRFGACSVYVQAIFQGQRVFGISRHLEQWSWS
jgi:hypothetical protein